jgi:hypothetical protein
MALWSYNCALLFSSSLSSNPRSCLHDIGRIEIYGNFRVILSIASSTDMRSDNTSKAVTKSTPSPVPSQCTSTGGQRGARPRARTMSRARQCRRTRHRVGRNRRSFARRRRCISRVRSRVDEKRSAKKSPGVISSGRNGWVGGSGPIGL